MPRLIVATVGTSLLDKLRAGITLRARDGSPVGNPLHDEGLAEACERLRDLSRTEVERRLATRDGQKILDDLLSKMRVLDRNRHRIVAPAEVASLWEMKADATQGDRAVLLYSDTPEGPICARALQRYLAETKIARCDDPGDIHCVEGLTTDDIQAFGDRGIPNLAGAIRQHIDRARNAELQPIVNVTGGYKGMTPFATLAALWSGVPVCYLYESAETNILLPPLPVQLNLPAYRRHRHLLNLIVQGNPGLYELLDESMRTLVEPDSAGGYRYTVFGEILAELQRTAEAAPGGGGLLLDHLTDPDLHGEVVERIKLVERLLQIEYRIPQVVDHAGAHLGALLEFVDEICLPILKAQKAVADDERRFSQAELYVLLSWVWLHDIGHAGGNLKHYTYEGIVMAPKEIRKLHHLMSHQRLLDDPKGYGFPDGAEDRVGVVAQTCIYHPYDMPMQNGDTAFAYTMESGKTISVNSPPREMSFRWKGNTARVRVPFLAALGRLIDACDVQRGRAGHPFYQMWRHRTTDLEERTWKQRQEEFRALYSTPKTEIEERIEKWMTGELDFRQIQRSHFEKHNQISSVLWDAASNFLPAGPFAYRIEIRQAPQAQRQEARNPDGLPVSVAVAALNVAKESVKKTQDAVKLYAGAEEERWLAGFAAWDADVSALESRLASRRVATALQTDEEQAYSRLIVKGVAADLIREYAKVCAILNTGGLYVTAILLIWEDELREQISLNAVP